MAFLQYQLVAALRRTRHHEATDDVLLRESLQSKIGDALENKCDHHVLRENITAAIVYGRRRVECIYAQP